MPNHISYSNLSAGQEHLPEILHERYSRSVRQETRVWWDVPALLTDPVALSERIGKPHLVPAFELAKESLMLLTEKRPCESTKSHFTIDALTPPDFFSHISEIILGSMPRVPYLYLNLNEPITIARTSFHLSEDIRRNTEEHALQGWDFLRDAPDWLAINALVALDIAIEDAWHSLTPDAVGLLVAIGRNMGAAQQMILTKVAEDQGVMGKFVKIGQQRNNVDCTRKGKREKAAAERNACRPLAEKILENAPLGRTQIELIEDLQELMKDESFSNAKVPRKRGEKFCREVFTSLGVSWGARKKTALSGNSAPE